MAKILIIDDSKYARLKLSRNIEEGGFEIVEAANGVEGLELTRSEKPDCIICDLLMPEMDGIGFLKSIKKEGIPIPVLILTSDIQEKTRERMLELGAVDVLHKPPKYDDVIEKLQVLIRERK
jgi:CheY-like chemotaxis protein